MSEARRKSRHELESLVGAGRRLVQASASVPREALDFLGRRRVGRRGIGPADEEDEP